MKHIEKIRALFTSSSSYEEKIIRLLESFFHAIHERKNDSIIGQKEHVNYQELKENVTMPKRIGNEPDVIKEIAQLYSGLILWDSPKVQMNVIPPPTSLSVAADAIASRFNQNSIWDQYGTSAAKAEVMCVGMLSELIGYDKVHSGGIFTFGGSGCNLYAARIGIEKALPHTKEKGLHGTIHVFCSDIAHYSIKSAIIWTGVGMDNIKVIPSDESNTMDVSILKQELLNSIQQGAKIGPVYATMGTTDAFGIDPLKKIYDVVKDIEKQLNYSIHIHADAVIGWPYLMFEGEENIQKFHPSLQASILDVVSKMSELKYADSVGIDFHKTGWTPYICSLLLVKQERDLFLLEKTKQEMPYLYQDDGYQPGVFTLESSRPDYAQKALANLLLLGREGFESIIAHLLFMSDYLRTKIKKCPYMAILNEHNPAFVTDFRFYPIHKHTQDAQTLYLKELNDEVPMSFTEQINTYNKLIADTLLQASYQSGGVFISYTSVYKPTKQNRAVLALKSYPMSPFVDKEHMDMLLDELLKIKITIDDTFKFDGSVLD